MKTKKQNKPINFIYVLAIAISTVFFLVSLVAIANFLLLHEFELFDAIEALELTTTAS